MSYDVDSFFDNLDADYAKSDASSSAYVRIADALRASLFKEQLDVVLDPARRKSVICPRRAGKSWTAMSYALDVCLRAPDRRVVIVTLTIKHAKNIYWREMQNLARQMGLPLHWHSHDMWVTFANGSSIMLIGGESIAEIEKLRGGKYDLVIIDECKSYSAYVMNELVDSVVWQALSDRRGTVMMIGTPGNVLRGLFYETTYPGYEREVKGGAKRPVSRTFRKPEQYWLDNPDKPYWSRHVWTKQDNVTVPHLWEEALEQAELNGWTHDHPTFRRESLGEWVASEDCFVYAYATLYDSNPALVTWEPDSSRHSTFGLPPGDWRYICGLDLGFEDDWAIVVLAYNERSKVLYHVLDYKANHQDIDAIAAKVLQIYGMFGGFDAMVGDFGGLGLLVMETLNNRHGLHIQKAEKREKFDHIELVNSDFYAGRLKIIKGTDLAFELETLQWAIDEGEDKGDLARRGKLKESAGLPNHLCDAMLYAWRFAMHYWSTAAKVEPTEWSPEWQREFDERAMRQIVAERDEIGKYGKLTNILKGLN